MSSGFHFDRNVTDGERHEALRISVTRCDAEDTDVQINIRPDKDGVMWPAITFFLSARAARELGKALTESVEEVADAS